MRRTRFRFPITTLAGSRLANISDQHKGFSVEPPYLLKYYLSCLVAGILEPFAIYENLRYREKIEKFRIDKPPVFIIGFWRSGTTFLHNVLCQDPEAAYTTTFQTVFPNHLLTQSWWMKPLLNTIVPGKRPYDNMSMDMDFPQEEDFGLMNVQPSSIYKFFLFPGKFDEIIDKELYTGLLPQAAVEQWKEAYRTLMIKAMINTGGTRYVGKNPCHLTRIQLILDMFPDAKFIFIHRHPARVIESMYQFFHSIFPVVQLQRVPESITRETMARLYRKIMDTYLENRQHIPSGNLIELGLDDFLRQPLGSLGKIYHQFGLRDSSHLVPIFENYLRNNAQPNPSATPPNPETLALVEKLARPVMHEFGYN
jgi:hypothetical protein